MISVTDIAKAFLIIGIYMDDGNALRFLRIFEQTLCWRIADNENNENNDNDNNNDDNVSDNE